jgi:hypothetical protein
MYSLNLSVLLGAGGSCNPSYSGGRDQEDLSLMSAQRNSFENTQHKKGLAEWLKW